MDTMYCTEKTDLSFQLVYQCEKCELTVKTLEFDDCNGPRKPDREMKSQNSSCSTIISHSQTDHNWRSGLGKQLAVVCRR